MKSMPRYIFSPRGRESEIPELIDVVTTNTTEFFREPNHFEFLKRSLLPSWLQQARPRTAAPFMERRVFSGDGAVFAGYNFLLSFRNTIANLIIPSWLPIFQIQYWLLPGVESTRKK